MNNFYISNALIGIASGLFLANLIDDPISRLHIGWILMAISFLVRWL